MDDYAHADARDLSIARIKWMLAALVFALLLQVVYFTGIVASDDLGYVEMIRLIDAGQPVSAYYNYYLARFVHWELVRLMLHLWPHWPAAIAMPSLAASLVTLVLVYCFGRRCFGWSDAQASMPVVLLGLIPVNVVIASVALPDTLATALAWGGVYLAATVVLQRDVSRPWWRCLVGGLLIAVGYNAKETVAAFVPGLMLFGACRHLRSRWIWPRLALLAVGAACWLVFETVLLWSWSGNWRFHADAVAAAHQMYQGPTVKMTAAGLLAYWSDYLRWLADPRSDYGLIGPILLAGVLYGVVRRQASVRLLLCLIVPAAVYLSVGSTDIHHYSPVIHQTRYLVPLLPGIALLTAALVIDLARRGALWRRAMTGLCIALAVACLPGPNRLAGRWYNAQAFEAGYRLMAGQDWSSRPNACVLAAGLTRNRFNCLPLWIECPPLDMIDEPPATEQAWVEWFGGAYVLTSRFDRFGSGKAKQARLTLHGASMEALSRFEHVGQIAPPSDRLSSLWAIIAGGESPSNSSQKVELWRVPTLAEWLNRPESGGPTSPCAPEPVSAMPF